MSGPVVEPSPLMLLGRWLQARDYEFTAVTPETHRRNNARAANLESRDLRDMFGWNRPFAKDLLPDEAFELLDRAGAVTRDGALWRSRVRYATLADNVFVHSAYPTVEDDSVFFGPDTYRFVAFVARHAPAGSTSPRVVDIGCGTGVGGIAVACSIPGARVVLADVNARALEYASINHRMAGLAHCECIASDVFAGIPGAADVVISNPPYMLDAARRVYRNGGDAWGSELSLRILSESLARLNPGGRLILYTGAAVVGGEDVFRRRAIPMLERAGLDYRYEEIDPDVFGEELDQPAYVDVERIAAVGLVAYAH
jgi:methylase of polypeptide subunit release factors